MKKMKFQEIEQREMPLINCKIGLKLKQTKYCAFPAPGTDNTNANSNKTQNYMFLQ